MTAIWRRRQAILALLVLSLVLAVAFREIVFQGRTLLSARVTSVMGTDLPYGYSGYRPTKAFRLDEGASAWQIEPLQRQVRRAYTNWQLPLWNPNAGTGSPLAADTISGAFNPLRLPMLLSNTPLTWDIYLLGRFLLGAAATYLFARSLGLGLAGALTMPLAFVLSGHFMLYSNNHWLDVYLSIPFILYGVELVFREARASSAIVLALGVALNLLAGMPESSFLCLLCVGGYAAYKLGFSAFEHRDGAEAMRRFVVLAVGFAAGFALAAPLLLPFAEYVNNSHSIHTPAHQLGLGHDPPNFVITLLVPHFNGSATGVAWWGLRNYFGLVVTFLAVLGLWHRTLGPRVAYYFLAVALLGITKTYGVEGINELGRLPLANLVSFAIWLSPIIAFCVAVAAGVGADRVEREEKLGWSLHIAVAAVVVIALYSLYLNRDSLSNLPGSSIKWLQVGFGLVLATWGLLWVAEDFMQGGLRKWKAWGCFALMTLELLLFAPHGIYRDRYDTFTKPPYVAYLQKEAEDDPTRLVGLEGVLFPDYASAYDLQDIRIINGIYPERYFTYVKEFVSPTVVDRFVGGPLATTERSLLVGNNPMLNLLGVKHVIANKQSGIGVGLPSPLIDLALRRAGTSIQVRRSGFTIDGVEKPVLFAAPPTDISVEANVGPSERFLRFSVALDPVSWDGTDDGVLFSVVVQPKDGAPASVFERKVDPRNNLEDRRWFDEAVDLSPYLGQTVTIHLVTAPGKNDQADWSGWGDIRLTGPTETPKAGQFDLTYDGEVQIYLNRNAFARAFVPARVEEVGTASSAIARMHQSDFDPAKLAVIEGRLSDELREPLISGNVTDASVSITGYNDQRVSLQTNMSRPGLVILTDTYYPGWKAYVDGRQTKIYATDYAFRGVAVPSGNHEVVFKYEPASLRLGLVVCILAIAGLGGWWGFDRYRLKHISL